SIATETRRVVSEYFSQGHYNPTATNYHADKSHTSSDAANHLTDKNNTNSDTAHGSINRWFRCQGDDRG
ncbi:MAG: hypothetical protein GY794_18900, partial [bacterium]|nr:hypothetical protein [bacterium]